MPSYFMGTYDAAYLAGLLDGEGYFAFLKRDKPSKGYHYLRYEPMIVLAMTDREFVEEISKIVPWGGGTVGRCARQQVGRAKPAWRIKWSGTAAFEIAQAIKPFVRLKLQHVNLLLALATAKKLAQPERSGHGHAYPLWLVQFQDSIAAEFSRLNRRGVDDETSNGISEAA